MEFHQNFYSFLLVMGGLIALVGILIFIFKKRSGENRIEVWSLKFSISDTSLVIVVMGCLIMIIAGMKVSDLSLADTQTGGVKESTTDLFATDTTSTVATDPEEDVTPAYLPETPKPGLPQTEPAQPGVQAQYAVDYSSARLTFCAGVRDDATGRDCGNQFTLEYATDYLYICLNNGNQALHTSGVYTEIYKWKGSAYAFYQEFQSQTDPVWAVLNIKIPFTEAGDYKAVLYNENRAVMGSGTFTLYEGY